jgi:HSP20 family protein
LVARDANARRIETKEVIVVLMKRSRDDMDWPPTVFGRRLFEWPESWKDFMEESALKVEEFEDEGELVVRVEMPGIDPDKDVEITVADHTLQLRAERRSEIKTEEKKGFHSEFRYGSFTRTVQLPAGAGESDVQASYTDGILEVRVPIDTAAAEKRKIPVTRGRGGPNRSSRPPASVRRGDVGRREGRQPRRARAGRAEATGSQRLPSRRWSR